MTMDDDIEIGSINGNANGNEEDAAAPPKTVRKVAKQLSQEFFPAVRTFRVENLSVSFSTLRQ